ncbi:hypothetical protein ANN_18058 [Periplaneta americana]|uniref:Uncharacterized protein n=1 Tax=Periplaneta americana TaxID=6978 RepID=A0ABQ8SN68_PERAM|nr:hypothetical protein ANN_18058 [Periplaneta americana]
MSPGSSTESYPAFARIGLRENSGKNLNQVTCPDRDSNPGHLVSQPDALTVTPQILKLRVGNLGWLVEEEISCLAENGSTRRVDILAYNAHTKQGIIVNLTIRFKIGCHQSAEVHLEKKPIYEPTVNYFKLKYALIHVEVFGLLTGVRGTIPAFFEELRRQFALPTSLRDDIVIIVLKKSCQILINHMVPH